MGKMGGQEFSRLMMGGNLIGGWSHSRDLSYVSTLARRYNTEAKIRETLELGEARGGDSTYFNRTIVILLHLVCLFTKLLPHLEKEQVQLK